MHASDMETSRVLQRLLGPGVSRKEGDEVVSVYLSALGLEIPFLDLMTARDLLETAGYEGDAPMLAVLLCLFGAMEEGSLCLDLHGNRLSAELCKFLSEERAKTVGEAFLSGLLAGRYDRLISSGDDGYLPMVLSEAGGERLLYFQKFYLHEKLLRRRMKTLLEAGPDLGLPPAAIDACLDEIYSPPLSIRVSRGGPTVERDELQLRAVRLAVRSRFSIVSGGPGTGKTSLMVNIIRCLARMGVEVDKILLAAPTGRAAQRMTEAIQSSIGTIREPSPSDVELLTLKASTLHKLLGYQSRKHDFLHGEANPLPASVVIVDEVSMVDVIMMEKFLRAVDIERTKVIFMGDKDQLPSVEAGAVFAEMIPHGERARIFRDHLTVLEKVYRSGEGLLDLARQVNRGEFPGFSPVSFESALDIESDAWAFVKDRGREGWRDYIRLWTEARYLSPSGGNGKSYMELIGDARAMDHSILLESGDGHGLLGKIFNKIEAARVLCLVRRGIYGSIGVNREIVRILNSSHWTWKDDGVFPGAVIMIRQNDYQRELFNGDVGVVIEDRGASFRAFFPRYGSYISFSMDMLPPWEVAFAMTVHKSQGSEFDNLLLVLPEDQTHRLLTREILYTGITRAKKRLIIFGREDALDRALQTKIERRSGFGW